MLEKYKYTLLLLLIASACAVISYFAIRSVLKNYDEYILAESDPIFELQKLNGGYPFHDVEPMYFEHRYDNEIFYDSVDEEDFLVEKLTHISSKVKRDIIHASENERLYPKYVNAVNSLRNFELYLEVNPLFRGYVKRKEKKIFESLVQKPCLDFYITICLCLTKINGAYVEDKEETFESDEIEKIIEQIMDKDGEFYLNQSIWDSICRVERAKVSNKMRFSIYNRDGNRCRKCGSRRNLEIDHIYPISKGGKTVYDNLQTLCRECNLKKSNTVERGAYNPRFDKKKHFCPKCNKILVEKNGANGRFYACPNYPSCTYTKST